jgi:hypothetical protein
MFFLLIADYDWPTDGQTGQTKWVAQRHATPEKPQIITTKVWNANSFVCYLLVVVRGVIPKDSTSPELTACNR